VLSLFLVPVMFLVFAKRTAPEADEAPEGELVAGQA
jgi:hypothetical protein